MKFIIAILLLTLATFAQDTTYKDGTGCGGCDSIHRTKKYDYVMETPYINAMKNGMERTFWLDCNDNERLNKCKPTLETSYVNGKKNGMEIKYWYSYGVMQETPYVNGKKNGDEKFYRNDDPDNIKGTLMSITPYVNDKKNGTMTTFGSAFDSTIWIAEFPYVNDSIIGIGHSYYKSRVLMSKMVYKSTNTHIDTNYYESGKLWSINTIVNGKLINSIAYYETGDLKGKVTKTKAEIFYQSGELCATMKNPFTHMTTDTSALLGIKSYYKSGVDKLVIKNTNAKTTIIEYYESTKPHWVTEFDKKTGKRMGVSTEYDENGDIINTDKTRNPMIEDPCE